MDKLLDKEVNTQYKAPSLVNYLNSRSSASSSASTTTAMAATVHPHLYPHPGNHHPTSQSSVHTDGSSPSSLGPSSSRAFAATSVRPHSGASNSHHPHGSDRGLGGGSGGPGRESEAAADTESSNDVTPTQSLPSSNSGSTSGLLSGGSGNGGARPKTTYSLRYNRWVPFGLFHYRVTSCSHRYNMLALWVCSISV